jgi:hypothetical protein
MISYYFYFIFAFVANIFLIALLYGFNYVCVFFIF